MSFSVPVHFVQAYTTNVQMLLQQKGGKLAQYCMQGSYTGKSAKAVEQFGIVKPVKNLSRHSDTPLISTPDDARWVFPNDWDWADMIDQQDRLRMLIDPLSSYVQNGVNAMRRAQDDEILQAFFANAQTGENGSTSTAFPAGQTVGVNVGGTASNLNVAKLRAARRLMRAAGVDIEADPLYVAVSSSDEDALLNEVQVTNLDYNSQPVLVNGKIQQFLGFTFIPIEFTDSNSYSIDTVTALQPSTTRFLPCWARSGMHFAMWQDVVVDVSRRPDKRNAVQVYLTQTCGATRIEEKRVVQIQATG